MCHKFYLLQCGNNCIFINPLFTIIINGFVILADLEALGFHPLSVGLVDRDMQQTRVSRLIIVINLLLQKGRNCTT